jgi:hypothetical protein
MLCLRLGGSAAQSLGDRCGSDGQRAPRYEVDIDHPLANELVIGIANDLDVPARAEWAVAGMRWNDLPAIALPIDDDAARALARTCH